MNFQLIIGLLLSISPIFELRGGLPMVLEYAVRNQLPILPYVLASILLNVFIISFVFLFLDFFHGHFMKIKSYRRVTGGFLKRIQKKADKLKGKIDNWGYLALMFFVAVPLPGTGAWTGGFIAWTLGLDRKKSFSAIALGIILSGIFILLASLSVLSRIY